MKSSFRRGFKKEAEDYAELYRQELGLNDYDPLDPRKLAEYLDIPVRELSSHPAIHPDVKEYWRASTSETFSGLIIEDGTRREILHNDYHPLARQNSNITHELAHVILGHRLTNNFGPTGERVYDSIVESEARWLGGVLLLPKKAVVHILLNSMPKELALFHYGVSDSMLQWRISVTDSYNYVKNIRRKYGTAAQ